MTTFIKVCKFHNKICSRACAVDNEFFLMKFYISEQISLIPFLRKFAIASEDFSFSVIISLINFQKSKRKWHWTKRVGTLLVRVVLYHLTSSPPPLRQMIAAPDTVNLIVILNNSLSFTSSFQNNEWNIATLIISVQHFVRYYNVIREQ